MPASFAYALDLSVPVSTSTFQCIRQSYYNVAFVRGYSPAGQGQFDPYACTNIQNANAAGLGTEVYMTPQPKSSKSGAQQFDEMYGGLRNSNINVRSVWIQQYGLSIGIYTNVYDWNQITGGASINNAMLWYWNVYGAGPTNESPANFNDFRSFGGWTAPSVKQFGQVESVCGVTVNRDIYTVSGAAKLAGMAKYEKTEQIVVGSLGLGSVAPGKAEIKQ
ncbi:hypothetical protein ANCCEY_03389 [Ancylostoma ceylanicum]|uniref:Lysozyme n=1 Tax=Ancylostoma ceylanicum TaxID=53326 RepID=A0A0D6MBA2_9BILA|nr:hypothetical protein ANCCEY_03389 [Ancylostoma ceylanicum]